MDASNAEHVVPMLAPNVNGNILSKGRVPIPTSGASAEVICNNTYIHRTELKADGQAAPTTTFGRAYMCTGINK